MTAPEPKFNPARYARPLRRSLIVLFGGLAAAVAFLQLRSADELARQSRREQTRLVYVPAKRGELQDRDGTVLNYSLPSYAIVLRPELVRDPRDTRQRTLEKMSTAINRLALAMGPEFNRFKPSREAILRHLKQKPALPLTLWEDVDADTIATWTALRGEAPGTELLLTWKRAYEMPGTAPQWRGFTRLQPPANDELERYWNANTLELTGAAGMESALDPLLKGRGGSQLLQTDVLSYRNRVIDAQAAVAGDDCRLTLHLPAQQLAQQLFEKGGYAGACIAMEMDTGEILVMHSAPSRPLGAPLVPGVDTEVNRALAGFYPPGSTLKPLLALFALENDCASANAPAVSCPGFFQLGSKAKLGCSHVHGEVRIRAALAQSCNTFFCQLACDMPPELLDEFAREFGFGERTGGMLNRQEIAGIPFSPQWVRNNRKNDRTWHYGDSANAGIGQGGWIVTPMQMLLAVNYAITGDLLEPKFYREGDTVIRRHRDWRSAAHETVLAGMRDCVINGTAHSSLYLPELPMLAKTGTAETGTTQKPHAWMVAAAPADKPKYLVVTVVEHGGGGGRVAGPITREVLKCLCLNTPAG